MTRFDGQKLRELRLAAGIRTEQLALDVERTNDTIRAYEMGKAKPTVGLLCRLADRLDVPVGELFASDAP